LHDIASHRAHRILLVDDDRAVQTLMQGIFQPRDIDVDVATNRHSVLRHIRKTQYDVVILELMLRNSSGIDILSDLKKEQPEVLRRTLVVTFADERTLAAFPDKDLVLEIVRKPFDLDWLVSVVCSCISPPAAFHRVKTVN
jgi:DNA-binding NtrC family response regulator